MPRARQRLVLEAGSRPLRLGRRAVEDSADPAGAGRQCGEQAGTDRAGLAGVVKTATCGCMAALAQEALGVSQTGDHGATISSSPALLSPFIAPLSIGPMTLPTDGPPHSQGHNLPLRRTRMIGRQALIDTRWVSNCATAFHHPDRRRRCQQDRRGARSRTADRAHAGGIRRWTWRPRVRRRGHRAQPRRHIDLTPASMSRLRPRAQPARTSVAAGNRQPASTCSMTWPDLRNVAAPCPPALSSPPAAEACAPRVASMCNAWSPWPPARHWQPCPGLGYRFSTTADVEQAMSHQDSFSQTSGPNCPWPPTSTSAWAYSAGHRVGSGANPTSAYHACWCKWKTTSACSPVAARCAACQQKPARCSGLELRLAHCC